MASERALLRGALQGGLAAVAFSFVVLLASTGNVHVSVFSTLVIGGILASVMAVMQFCEWEMGTAESIAVVILIGFSVDYVVHLGNHYTASVHLERVARMQEALGHIGISIMGGAVTTAGSAFFLFFAELNVLRKFGLIISVIIGYSLLFSLVFFPALCFIAGPEGKSGDLMTLAGLACKYCRRKTKP